LRFPRARTGNRADGDGVRVEPFVGQSRVREDPLENLLTSVGSGDPCDGPSFPHIGEEDDLLTGLLRVGLQGSGERLCANLEVLLVGVGAIVRQPLLRYEQVGDSRQQKRPHGVAH
jgi:hypothetical protein